MTGLRTDADSTIEHYMDLLVQHEWLARGGLGWSVVCRLDPTGSAEQAVVESLGASPVYRDVDIRESDLYPTVELFISVDSNCVSILERDGIYHSKIEWLRWLSRDARLWHVSWHARGHDQFVYAENGQLLVHYPEFRMDDATIYGEIPPLLEDHIRILIGSPSNERLIKRAAAMATVESASSFQLRDSMLIGTQRALLADRLIEGDPNRALSLRHVDSELYGHVSEANTTQRRQICLLVLNRMAQRYFAKSTEVVKAANAGVNQDVQALGELMPGLIEHSINLGREWFNGPGGTPREEDRRWMRWQASIATRLALQALAEDTGSFEMLIAAKSATGKGWPELRAQITKKIIAR
ncbi:hypothetical protein ACFWY5_41445 [Nonomuraea sp. NPDC059007]|uniref:hypothetical protein n=1 Tax=Nonomuraea sp. NPDC059007 TaxID=3346692 RepID=UPI0036A64183